MDRSDKSPIRREAPRREASPDSRDAQQLLLQAGLQANRAPRVQQAMPMDQSLTGGPVQAGLSARPVLEVSAGPRALPSDLTSPGGRNQIARGGVAVAPLSLQAAARIEREDAMARLIAQQRLLAIDPSKATPEEARELGHQAALNRVNSAMWDGGPESGLATLRSLREGLAAETLQAREAKRPRSLERLVRAGVVPQGADRVLPRTPEVQQAYIEGMEQALVRRSGMPAPAAETLIKDRPERLLQEQLRVHGPSSVLGHKAQSLAVEGVGVKAQAFATIHDVVDGMSPDSKIREVHLALKAMEQARERHAQVAEHRAGLSTQSPESLRLVGEIKAEDRGTKVSESIREAYRQQELYLAAPRVRSEFEALKPYLDLRMAAVAHAEAGNMSAVSDIQMRAHELFTREVAAGRISEETIQGIRQAGMDPVSTLENLRGINPTLGERQWLDIQAQAVRQSVPSNAEQVQVFGFRAPGRVFEDALPLVAYQHQGQTHVAFEVAGKIQHAALTEAVGDAGSPAHAMAVQFQSAMSYAEGPMGTSDFKLSQKGFLSMDSRPHRPGPGEGAPIHVGMDRTRGAA